MPFSVKELKTKNTDEIREKYQEYSKDIDYKYFEYYKEKFVEVNKDRYLSIVHEATEYIKTFRPTKQGYEMELFNSYARGGIEYLYEKLVVRPVDLDDDEFTDARMSNIRALFKDDMQEI